MRNLLARAANGMADRNQGIYNVQLTLETMADQRQFHVDNLSSAHVYLRLKAGESWTSIDRALLEDCAQLTKANSIEGKERRRAWRSPVPDEGY